MKIVKSFVLWVFYLVLRCASLVGFFVGLYYYWRYLAKSVFAAILMPIYNLVDRIPIGPDEGFSLKMLLIMLLILCFSLLSAALAYLLLPYIWFHFCLFIFDASLIRRKNAWYDFCYAYEDALHLEHKPRLNGTEWQKKKEREHADEHNKKTRERNRGTQEQAQQQQYYNSSSNYSYSGNAYQEQQNDIMNDSEQVEFLQALGFFAYTLDEFKQTNADELKHRRKHLIKRDHPDENDSSQESTIFTQKLNAYYAILQNKLKDYSNT